MLAPRLNWKNLLRHLTTKFYRGQKSKFGFSRMVELSGLPFCYMTTYVLSLLVQHFVSVHFVLPPPVATIFQWQYFDLEPALHTYFTTENLPPKKEYLVTALTTSLTMVVLYLSSLAVPTVVLVWQCYQFSVVPAPTFFSTGR